MEDIVFKKLTVKEKAGAQAGQVTPPPETITGMCIVIPDSDCSSLNGSNCGIVQPQPDCFTAGAGEGATADVNYCDIGPISLIIII